MIDLRPVRPTDASAIADLLTQLGYPADADQVRARLRNWLPDQHSRLVAAESDGVVVGVAALHVMPLLEYDGRLARLLALVVDQAWRGHGVGRALVTRAEHEARELGCRELEITSSRYREDAHRFYHGLGYEDVCGRKARLMKAL
ncbi:GNAT family N-acetyltransferase [Actinophytocola gossypii]|uniref:GNAT family N-acetyltransferase n=1 Tax=Actinophytocola gossypii TaxID=2812003 RepID=A0ABT2J688_9PSEU|nr:GNAT family N-acetyltransferase [Actinophytocola gossypii]MCT2583382.1 GNAT family N-acetyltransferase [Actinophytocola gossypii]